MKKYILILVILLSGCSVFCPKPPEIDPNIIGNRITIDPKLLQECPLINKSGVKDTKEVLMEDLDVYGKYGLCARKQSDSIKALKLLGDIK